LDAAPTFIARIAAIGRSRRCAGNVVFRNAQAFDAMVQDVLLPKLRADPMAQVRLLSLPCSSGEEAYTMAMALIDAGIPASRFCIEAIDISQQAIDQARAGSMAAIPFADRIWRFATAIFVPRRGMGTA
jgi:chemotaxis protein methyltransferase WspC